MELIKRAERLLAAYKSGLLGGEKLPEHENPGLDPASRENYMYFTLPMALNYRRNSYALWECANRLYSANPEIFESGYVCRAGVDALRERLVEYRVALQPNRHPAIWLRLCETLEKSFDGDVRNLIMENGGSVEKILTYIAGHKHDFPYLGGNKICNYWLYVLEQHTDVSFVDRERITVAPDTHIIKASVRLGVISSEEAARGSVQELVAARWDELLRETDIAPIDMHTPMWLWSRGKFSVEI